MTHDEIDRRLEKLRAACRAAGVKLTHQRLEIFREVLVGQEHPDAEAVFEGVQRRLPTVSLDTVYRTLWMLTDLGLVSTLGPRRERARFDANLAPHHHYVCTACGLARDFESPELDALRLPAGAGSFGSVAATYVEVRGLCATCLAQSARP